MRALPLNGASLDGHLCGHGDSAHGLFVLILSFTEMEIPPSSKKFLAPCRILLVFREVPSVEPHMAQNIIAKSFRTSKVEPSVITNVKEETTDEEPQETELKSTKDPLKALDESDTEFLKRALKTHIAKGKVKVEEMDGEILITVLRKSEDAAESQFQGDESRGQIDEDTIDIFAQITEAQSFGILVEVQFDQGDSGPSSLSKRSNSRELKTS